MPPTLTFDLRALPPFRLDLTVWALRRRAENRIDAWDGRHYRRLLVIDGRPRALTVAQASGLDSPNLEVRVDGPDLSEHEIPVARLEERGLVGRAYNPVGVA
jgi:DNA-3-methyladenine glycosylase II